MKELIYKWLLVAGAVLVGVVWILFGTVESVAGDWWNDRAPGAGARLLTDKEVDTVHAQRFAADSAAGADARR